MASIPGLVIPTGIAQLIVPSATVAEIIQVPATLHPLPAVAPWVLGYFRWRNYPVTLVSFERLAADRDMSGFSRVCVFYPLPGREPYDYFAFVMRGDPRSLEIPDSADAGALPEQMSSRFAAGVIKFDDRTLVIPDFAGLREAFYSE